MIAQHRMIRSASRPRIGSPLRGTTKVLLSSFTFQFVRDNRSIPRIWFRERSRSVYQRSRDHTFD